MTEEAIVSLALERPTHAARAAFLAEACGEDAALRRRVEALLQAREQEGDHGGRSDATAELAGEGRGAGGHAACAAGLAPSGLTEALGARRDATEDLTALAPREAAEPSPDDTGATIGLPRERGWELTDGLAGEGGTHA